MTTRKLLLAFAGLVAISGLTLALYFSIGKQSVELSDSSAYSEYISAYTAGVVSKKTVVTVKLTESAAACIDQNKINLDEVFSFDPGITGKTYWVDKQTIEFKPDEDLPNDTRFVVTFNLGKVIQVPEQLSEFKFEFRTIRQNFDVIVDETRTTDKETYKLQKTSGFVVLADEENLEVIQKIVKAYHNGKELPVKWSAESDNRFQFEVDSVVRTSEESSLIIKWNGEPINVDYEGETEVIIPALNRFLFMSSTLYNYPEQYIKLQFSDPLNGDQDLNGLVKLTPEQTLRYIIDDNIVKVYPVEPLRGEFTLTIDQGILNTKGKNLEESYTRSLVFEDMKPQVRLIGKGVILPNSPDGLVLPFEAVNLRAVDVRIIKIYENNVTQFLQVNDLEGSSELYRVGEIVFMETVPLEVDGTTDLSKWNRFTLDLNKLIKAEPGAIYRVSIGFRKIHSVYPCAEENEEEGNVLEDENNGPKIESSFDYYDYSGYSEYSYWDTYDYYYEYDDYNNYWSNRENPCHRLYYNSEKSVSTNIIASDLGIIAKKGNDGSMVVFIANILTAKPMSNVEVEIYNFQRQLLKSESTDAEGKVIFTELEKPYFVVAKSGDQRGYLRIIDGSSLSLSAFAVDGVAVVDGLKGYIYGERGVWRPGDSLYITFILEENGEPLPESHPITFELRNPNYQLVKRMVQKKNKTGFYQFNFTTNEDAPTGYWDATIRVGGATFNKKLKIETIKPNRLKISLDFGVTKIVKGQITSGKLNVKWLHGAVVKNLRAQVDVILNPVPTQFEKYKDFTFDDPTRKYYSELIKVYDQEVDENGNGIMDADINVEGTVSGFMKATFITKVYEKGGDFSIDQMSIPYYPYESYIGLKLPKGDKSRGMLLTDTTHKVEMLIVDANGKLITGTHEIEMQFYKIDWKWWWDRSEDYLSNYNGNSYIQPLSRETIKSVNGKASWKIRVDYPEWGRYLVRAEDKTTGHSCAKIVYIDWPGWAGREMKDHPGAATILTFTADKEKYDVGEVVKITIPSSEGGRALISIENGTKELESHWVETQKGTTEFTFKATAEMTPNIYVNITLLQPHSQTLNDLPIRLYGIIPLIIEDPKTHLTPVIDMPDKLRAESKMTLKVSEKDGREMTYTIAIVDEGLLDLTRFATPDPWNEFYAKEALGVRTWDLYDLVIGSYGGKIERLLGIGGDGSEDDAAGNKKAQRFKPMVKFLGPYHLDKGDVGVHTIEIPNYIGSVRTMVVAGHGRSYGKADKTTPVTKPLMVLATLPRVLGPGEVVKLPVTVFGMENHVKNATVTIKTSGPLQIVGGNSKTVTFAKPGEENIEFNLEVKNQIGIGKVEVIAVSGNEKSTYSIEIDVRHANPPVTDVIGQVVPAGQTIDINFTPVGIAGTNATVLELSSIPPLNLEKRLRYLITYPHGCIEQTTSAAFPQLYLADLLDLDKGWQDKIKNNITAGIQRLSQFQTYSGGFAYWSGGKDVDDWGTTYAGHFLLEAQKKGYLVSESLLKKWKKYQKQVAQNWVDGGPTSQFMQAYRLYTLALSGSPEIGAMNRLKESKHLSNMARWRLASAYHLAGKTQIALKLIEGLPATVTSYNEMAFTYGSNVRDLAMILETQSMLGKKNEAYLTLKAISDNLSTNTWYSTQTTAYSLIAISKYLGDQKPSSQVKASYSLNGGKWVNLQTIKYIAKADVPGTGSEPGKISIKNTSNGVLFARVYMEGIPAPGSETDAENGLRLSVNYKLLSGIAVDPSKMEQGTDFFVTVTVTNPSMLNYKQLALSQVFPSGWEIINTRLLEIGNITKSSFADYQDIRDDRIYTYFDLPAGQTKTYTYLLNSSYFGKYYLPAVNCEAMYDVSISARRKGMWVEVVQP